MSFQICATRILKQELTSLTHPTGQVGPLIQSIRWVKPRYKPIAKSKQFYVREPTPQDPEEQKRLKFLNNEYSTYLRALRTHFLNEIRERPKITHNQNRSEDFRQLLLENDKWNAQVAQEREADMARLSELDAERKKLKSESYQQYRLDRMIEAEKKFSAELEKPFISLQDLDKEIALAIDSKVNYNFAIDKKGNLYKEEEPKLLEEKPENTKSE
ncbi:probable 28S ribosomal protein S26, mitochondrial [Octopus bimaculoides]|uniref:Small ribosomal subunit protein mS26 n=1 Tax=Octopus bimaculoides TaxID=37653 RepID=A0A0L8FN30_OCTBM|nr:probable 28S ribosomal protein S26, mitochondrial [Octopus bimaculoides]|eukprot:XP_014788585.1 PREDICTED: probable 28S ribosomal protein S26, mitochondrial [Octopus bimaculoides]